MNFKRLLSLVVVGLFVGSMFSGCSSTRKKTDGEGDSSTGGASESGKVESTPISFNASGSDSGSINGLQSVNFEFDSSTLTNSELSKLKGNADWMKANTKVVLTVEGHCDQKGSNEYNLALGERRAAAVKKLLAGYGVPANRLTTVSFGEEKLVTQGESESDMARNRRANFVPSTK